jgi:hypothetical protein
LIEVTFTKDKILELDEQGQHGSDKMSDRILMSVKNISGIENMAVDYQVLGSGDLNLDDSFKQVSNYQLII